MTAPPELGAGESEDAGAGEAGAVGSGAGVCLAGGTAGSELTLPPPQPTKSAAVSEAASCHLTVVPLASGDGSEPSARPVTLK